MADYYTIRLRRGRLIHLITVDSDSPRETLCDRLADGAIVSDVGEPCRHCEGVRLKRTQAAR